MPRLLPKPPALEAGSGSSGGKGGQKAKPSDKDKDKGKPPPRRRRADTAGASAPASERPPEDEQMDEEEAEREEHKPKGQGRSFTAEEKKATTKRKGQLAKLSPGLRLLLQVLLRSSLSLQQRQRSLERVVFDMVVVKVEFELVDQMMEQGRAFALGVEENQAKKQDDRVEIGPPHLFVFAALLAGLLEEGEKIGAANKEAITEFQEKYDIMENEEAAEAVDYCRLERCYKPEFKKVVLAIGSTGIRSQVLSALAQLGGSRKMGRAPRGAQERDFEVWLQSLEA